MHYGLVVSVGDLEGEVANVWEQLEPFTGETNKLDGARPVKVWVRGDRSELAFIATNRKQLRDTWRAYRRMRDEFIRDDVDKVRIDELFADSEVPMRQYVRERSWPVPYAYLFAGEWGERPHSDASQAQWREAYLSKYWALPGGTVLIWLDCHR
jgi:hypothetical protein